MSDLPRNVGRCEITGNPCGTDTWVKGDCCRCNSCRRWVIHQWSIDQDRIAELKEWQRTERVIRKQLLTNNEQLETQVDRVCEWYEVSCYDELPFVVDEMCEGQISVRQETKLDAPRGLDQLAVPPDER